MKSDDFTRNITEYVSPKNTLILGVSGGADSVYLFERCLEICKRVPFNMAVAHVNHGLRGKESDKDEKFVENLCKKNRIPFHTVHLDLSKQSSKNGARNLEEAGRDARYKFFESVRKRTGAEWVLTAHHLNDNIETMLFNLIRGAHFNGIKGMEVASPARHLLRPLLGITKREILDYMKKHKIAHRHDQSNDNTDFSRNWLRKNIIPLFPKLNANFEQTFRETLHNLSLTTQYLEEQCAMWLKKHGKKMVIDLDTFLAEHRAFQKHLLVHLYKSIHKSTKKLTNKHLEEVLQVLHQRRANRKKEFGPGLFIQVVREPQKRGGNKKRYIRLIGKK